MIPVNVANNENCKRCQTKEGGLQLIGEDQLRGPKKEEQRNGDVERGKAFFCRGFLVLPLNQIDYKHTQKYPVELICNEAYDFLHWRSILHIRQSEKEVVQ